jgi:hypothetical protein
MSQEFEKGFADCIDVLKWLVGYSIGRGSLVHHAIPCVVRGNPKFISAPDKEYVRKWGGLGNH